MDSRIYFRALSLCLLLLMPVILFSFENYSMSLKRHFSIGVFLSEEECDHLVVLAKGKLEKSMVADNESGKSTMNKGRTSSRMFLNKARDEIVARIDDRIAAWTFIPAENGDSIQILHYENGEKYEPRYDYFHDKANQELGGHRVATVLMYLANIEQRWRNHTSKFKGKSISTNG